MKKENMVVKTINLSDIDGNDKTFHLYNPNNPLNIDDSLVNYYPITVQKTPQNAFRIIDGFTIYRYFISSKIQPTIAVIEINSNVTEYDLWLIRLKKRIWESNFSLCSILEKLSVLAKMNSDDFYQNSEVESIAKQLKLPNHITLDSLMKRQNDRNEAIQKIVNPHVLNIKELICLIRFDVATLSKISVLLEGMNLKGNKLISCLTIIEELQNGFSISIDDILNDGIIKKILETDNDNLKFKLLKSRLLELRYPKLHQMRNDWQQCCHQLDLAGSIRISIDEYFENDYLSVELQASSSQKLLQDLKHITDSTTEGKLNPLFDLI